MFVPPPPGEYEAQEADISKDARLYLHAYRCVGRPLQKTDKILDFGCGDGSLVTSLRHHGYDVHGYEIANYLSEESRQMPELFSFYDERREPGDCIIDWGKFILPYPDNYFDAVFSHQVFEHLMEHEPVFREFARVLKPGAYSINCFPSKYYFFETHLEMPFAHWIPNRYYFYFMALLGCHNKFQKDLSAKRISEIDYEYMRTSLNYISHSELMRMGHKYFTYCTMRYDFFSRTILCCSESMAYFLSYFRPNVFLVMANLDDDNLKSGIES